MADEKVPAPAATKPADVKPDDAKRSSVEAAQSVADAVKRVADAAVAEVQKAPVAREPVDFAATGKPGGTFTIRGDGFSSGGVVTFNGVAAETTAWGGQYIAGRMPAGAKDGDEVRVIIDAKTSQRGRLGS